MGKELLYSAKLDEKSISRQASYFFLDFLMLQWLTQKSERDGESEIAFTNGFY